MEEKKNPLAAATTNGNTEIKNRDDYTTDEGIGKEALQEWEPEDEQIGYRATVDLREEIPESRIDRFLMKLLCALVGILIFMAGMMAGMVLIGTTSAESSEGWIICQPGDFVNARSGPSRKSGKLGRLDWGDQVHLAGGMKNGFLKVERLSMEESEGWVHSGYVIWEAPKQYGGKAVTVIADGRVACRKYIDGPRRCWVHAGDTVKVYSAGGGWAVTNKGFIRTEYLAGL